MRQLQLRHRRRGRAAGALVLLAVLVLPSAASAHDSANTPTALEYGIPQVAGTTAFDVDKGEPNTGPSSFTETCGLEKAFGVSRTAWYFVRGTGGLATVSTAGSSFDTALFVYSGAAGGPLVTCNDDVAPGVSDFTSSVTFATSEGTKYAIQAGGPCDASTPPCPRKGGTLHIAATNTVPGPPPPPDSADFAGSAKRLRVSRSGHFAYRFRASAGRAGSVTMASARKVRTGGRLRTVKVPRRKFTPTPDGGVALRFRLPSSGLRALKRTASVKFTVTVVVGSTSFTAKLTLTRPKRA